MAPSRPLRTTRYRLEIDGVPQAGFSEVAIGETAIDAVDYRGAARTRRGSNITLKRGIAPRGTAVDLFQWHRRSRGKVNAQPKNVVIVAQDEAGGVAARFAVTGALPVKYESSDLNAKGNEVTIELLELASDGIEPMD
jgi:phage tail-like protein